MSFRDNLREELIYNDLKVKELAFRINLPYSTTLSYVDNRAIIPNAEIAVKIAKVLNVSVEYLVTGKEDKNPTRFKDIYPLLYPTIEEMTSFPKPLLSGLQKFIHTLYLNSQIYSIGE